MDTNNNFNFNHDNIVRLLKNRWNNNKLEKYISNKANKTEYNPPNSNKQIHTIVKYGTLNDYYRLFLLISKFIDGNNNYKKHYYIQKIIQQSQNDDDIYENIKYLFKKKIKRTIAKRSDIRNSANNEFAKLYYHHIKKHILDPNPDFVIGKYLDVGCGTCDKTQLLGSLLDLKKNSIYGIDIEGWSEYFDKNKNVTGIIFNTYKENELFPYDDNTFGIISCFMVLHHIKNLSHTLKEIYRCMKPGGYLIIREHDLYNNIDYMITDVEHSIYDNISAKNSDKKYEYYSRYYNWIEWDVILDSFKFDYIDSNYDTSKYIFEVSPTRYFYGIYKKTNR